MVHAPRNIKLDKGNHRRMNFLAHKVTFLLRIWGDLSEREHGQPRDESRASAARVHVHRARHVLDDSGKSAFSFFIPRLCGRSYSR